LTVARPITEVDMTRPHHYVQCDVPEGMTLAEYRSAKSTAKPRKTGLVSLLRRRRTRPATPAPVIGAEGERRMAA
jgi:hypothetical protein